MINPKVYSELFHKACLNVSQKDGIFYILAAKEYVHLSSSNQDLSIFCTVQFELLFC